MEFNYEQIEKYIKGELSSTEAQSFEQELSGNSALKEEVALYKDVQNTLSKQFKFEAEDAEVETTIAQLSKKYAAQNFKNNVSKPQENKEEEVENSKVSITRRLLPLTTLAAAAALLLFFFNPFTNKISPSQIVTQNFERYEPDAYLATIDVKTAWQEAIKNYRAENYEVAITKFNSFLKDNPNNKEALLAKGCALLKLNKTDLAIQTFQQINNSKTANWYLALSYLKNDEVTKAQPILEGLLDNKKYGAKAKAIMRDL